MAGRTQSFALAVATLATVVTITPSMAFPIRSVVIDNPSGLWLYLTPNMRFVKPQTTGFLARVNGANTITIVSVTAPTGGAASSAVGGPVIVTLYEDDGSDYPGDPYTLVQNLANVQTSVDAVATAVAAVQTAVNNVQTSVNSQISGFGTGIVPVARVVQNVPDNTPRTLVPATVGKTGYLVSVLCAWQSITNAPLRGYIDIGVTLDLGTNWFPIVLTPQNPTFFAPFGYGVPASATNQVIQWEANTGNSAPINDSSISIIAVYYKV